MFIVRENKKRILFRGMLKKILAQVPLPRDHFREYHISLRHRSCIPLLRKLIVWPPGGLHRFINQFSNSDSQIVIFYIELKISHITSLWALKNISG
ncbi:hypothetical protein UUU_18570 [Klebsiella pneumoniae subsp. pneumoniae DSM 30104 = JCM 1662 = NBRC 14940]|nr:hypothetical protein UUU_18570 [Klebsiella pneumoniae subsp. pneumoniae DSM 30104 = JCM 1662 = NBRC 14940]